MPAVSDPDDPRPEPPTQGDERSTLMGFLGWHRATLEMKCEGLDAAAMARRSVEPSSMSLLGLVRHLADVERFWFREVLAGEERNPHYWTTADLDVDFDGAVADDAVVEEAWATWRAEVAFGDELVANAPNLDISGYEEWRGQMSLRWVLVHLVEEYARHNGHADLLRQRIDGAVGD